MEIVLNKIGRRFNREWIFKNIDYTFKNRESYAILGINGSGKSTLLQILSGALSPSSGKILFSLANKTIDAEEVYKNLSISAPYLELIEEFTLLEIIAFHFSFKTRLNNISDKEIVSILGMEKSQSKQLKYFSSGIKQRVKLALAIFADTLLILLDEPTSNLDEEGIAWYHQLIANYTKDRLLIICSNQPVEYSFCKHKLHIAEFKGGK